jgi:hypothetical protein
MNKNDAVVLAKLHPGGIRADVRLPNEQTETRHRVVVENPSEDPNPVGFASHLNSALQE